MSGATRDRNPGEMLRIRTALRVAFEAVPAGTRIVSNAVPERGHASGAVLQVLLGSGRGSALHASMASPAVLIPLRGRIRMLDGTNGRVLRRGDLFVVEGGQRLQVVGGVDASWVAVLAPSAVWWQLVRETSDALISDPVLLPALHAACRVMRRAAIGLVREARTGRGPDALAAALVFTALLADRQQSAFDPRIERSPGRTLAQRRAAFARLQRAYHLMESGADADLDVAAVARATNYSPCYFARAFNEVYGATPHAVIVEQRFRRALHLVQATELSIAEVANAAGFEDRCAFARSFKRRFGRTATALREGTGG